jgi:hypothetical protein
VNEQFVIAFSTFPETARKISRELVNSAIVARVNIIPVESIYYWKEKVETGAESRRSLKNRGVLFRIRTVYARRTVRCPRGCPPNIAEARPIIFTDWRKLPRC